MDELKIVRATNRRLFTKACNEFSKLEASLSVEDKIARLRIIEKKAQLMLESEENVRQLYFKNSDVQELELEKEIDESEAYIDKWRLLEQKLIGLTHVENNANINVETPRNALLRYPEIKLPTFDGNVKNWLAFWGQFKKIDSDPNLDDHDKFVYLLQSMQKGSSAEELIKSFPPGGESYSKALQQLQSRFAREDLLIEVYVRDLLSLVLLKNSNQKFSLRKLYDNLESKLRALEILGVARDKYAAMLYPLVESSLPDDILRAWQRFRAMNRSRKETSLIDESDSKREKVSSHRMDLDGLLSFLLDEIEGEERVSIANKCFVKDQCTKPCNVRRLGFKNTEHSALMPSASALVTTCKNTPNLCIFCSGAHESSNCNKACKMLLEERQAAVQKSRCCFLCLGRSHLISKCRSKVNCCVICGKKHHLLLCKNLANTNNSKSIVKESESIEKQDETLANISGSPNVLLQTLTVIIKGPNKQRKARAIIDSASQRSYILKKTANEMGYITDQREQLRHSLFGGSCTDIIEHEVITVTLSKIDGKYNCHFEALSQDIICDTMPPVGNGEWIKELKSFNIDLHDTKAGPIEVLIGADIAGKLMTGGYKLLPSGLAAVETKLGWTILGKNPYYSDRQESAALLVMTLVCSDNCISNLWSLESIGILDPSEKKSRDEIHEAAKEHFLRTVTIDEEGRYIVNLPWLDEHPPLPDNFNLALKRLNNVIKTLKSKNLYEAYDHVFKEWLKEQIIEEVPEDQLTLPSHYLPHRPVVKESSTTPIRPVFDASSKSKSSPSLNDCLEKGLNLIEFIPSILTRFRLYRIGVSADIRKAFLQIRVSENDKNFLRFLWYDETFKLKYFRHCRVVFGVTSSPFLLGSVIQHHLESTLEAAQSGLSKYPVDIVQRLVNSFYVDNCLLSVKDEAQLHKFIQVASELMWKRKFELRGWEYSDNHCLVVEPTNILGMLWDRASDTLGLKVSDNLFESSGKISKRVILSTAQKIYDPLGVACPVTLLPKLLLQKIWKSKLNWDQEVDSNTKEEFEKWLKNLKHLNEVKIPRWIQCDHKIDSLHFFCDASKTAYSATAFIKTCSNGFVNVHLLRAKSRIAPCGKKETTIARLELLAATISARLSTDVLKEFKSEKVFFWTDSTTVLSWLKREEPWGVFVQNRVEEIRKLSSLDAWRHIPGSLNPADLPSRGCSAHQLLKSKWWEGPPWLYLPAEKWPKSEFCVDEEEVLNERKKRIVSTMVNIQRLNKFITDRFSSYTKTVRMIGWIYRFFNNVSSKNKLKGELTTEEYEKAEIVILRLIQSEQLHDNKILKKFQTFKDNDELLRVKTKLFDCEETYEFKYPILLLSNHNMVLKLVMEEHKRSLHAGLSTLQARVREKYWILGIRKLAKHVISKCSICKRHTAKPLDVPFAPLPRDRVTNAGVFEVSGADYAGPLYLRSGEKAWIILFTCAVYRAVHFELVKSLTTESFIQGLRRFIARRGRIAVLYTDNGKNFIGANNMLKALDWNKISSYSTTRQISWKFIPPTAAWWGGWWERMVRMLKELLRRMLGKSCVNYEELSTLLCDCEAVINSRPLTYIPNSPDELMPLTPAMFLVNDNCANSGTADLDAIDKAFFTRRSKYLQKLRADLRRRFRNEYLALLVHRGNRRNNSLRIGDIVLIGSDGAKRNDWPLGVILETYSGKDNISRVARIKTHQGERIRPFQKLYPLELSVSDVNSLKLPMHVNKIPLETDLSSNEIKISVPSGESKDASRKTDETKPKNSRVVPKVTRAGRKIKVPERLDL